MPQNPPVQGPWKESGVFSPVVVVAPLVAFIVALPLAALYALINIHVPIFGIVTVVALGAFAFGSGFTGGLVMGGGRSRNTKVTTLVSFLGALLGLWALWSFFLFFLLRNNEQDPSLLAIFLNPVASWEVMNVVAIDGWFTVKGSTPSGAVLWVLWGAEALVFIGISLMASSAAASVVWCEACGVDMGGRTVLEAASGTGLADIVKRGGVAGLDAVTPDHGMAIERLTVHACPTCKYAVADVTNIIKTLDKKGEVSESTTSLLPKYVVSPHFVERAARANTPPMD